MEIIYYSYDAMNPSISAMTDITLITKNSMQSCWDADPCWQQQHTLLI